MADALTASDIARYQQQIKNEGASGVDEVYKELQSKEYASADWCITKTNHKQLNL